jgi:hypothetical protein
MCDLTLGSALNAGSFLVDVNCGSCGDSGPPDCPSMNRDVCVRPFYERNFEALRSG